MRLQEFEPDSGRPVSVEENRTRAWLILIGLVVVLVAILSAYEKGTNSHGVLVDSLAEALTPNVPI